MTTLPERDLEDILEACEDVFATLRGARIFMTGGTGFVGSWLTESLLWANRRLDLGATLTLLVRDVTKLAPRFTAAAEDGALSCVTGDVRTFELDVRPDVVINAATASADRANDPFEVVSTIVDGARNVLRIAERSGDIPVLFTSSGAVYGRQPPELERVSESYAGAPNALDPRFAYHEAKRLAELLHVAAAQRSGVRPKIARLFAFVGPYLPLNAHFAIGNFIRDALDGGPIVIRGDGTPIRSYLYAADMATWLWRILVHGEAAVAYNVGSEMPISIEATAQAVAACAGLPPQSVEIRGKHAPNALAQRYVPDTGRARAGLGLQTTISIAAAIERTMAFYRASPLTRPITSFSKR